MNVDGQSDEVIRHLLTATRRIAVVDREAASRAMAAGITVVMDRCPVIEDRRPHLCDH